MASSYAQNDRTDYLVALLSSQ